jgi:type I restriction enzyme, S subunit
VTETVALGEVALSLQDGPFGSNLKSSHYVDHGVRVIRLQNIGVGYFDDRDRAFVSEEHFARLRKYECRTGDVLIATLGDPIIRACRQPLWLEIALNKADCLRLRCDPDRIVPEYLVQFLNSDALQSQANGLVHGQTRPRVNLSQLRSVRVPLPPLPEQRRIARILDDAYVMRAKRRAALTQLDALTHSIFLDMFGDPERNTKGWPMTTLGAVTRDTKLGLVRGSSQLGDNLPFRYFRMNAIAANGGLDINNYRTTTATPEEVAAYRLEPGDLLFNTRNSQPLVGKTALFRDAGIWLFNNNIMRIRFNAEVNPEFIAALFQTPFARRQLASRTSGTTSVFAIYWKDLKTLRIPIPPLSVQQEFALRAAKVRWVVAAQADSLRHLDALFASLQHRAFRGER